MQAVRALSPRVTRCPWPEILEYAADQAGVRNAGRGPRRHPDVEALYAVYKAYLAAESLTNHDYVVRFTQWEQHPSCGGCALEPNLVPYNLEEGTMHWVLWHHPDSMGGMAELDAAAEFALLEQLLAPDVLQQLGAEAEAWSLSHEECIVVQNIPIFRSIPSIAHSHVFLRPGAGAAGRALHRALCERLEAWRRRSPWLTARGGDPVEDRGAERAES